MPRQHRDCAIEAGLTHVVPPKANRKELWEYDINLYKKRNEVERYFLRLKRFRRIFTGYDKLDIRFTGFMLFVAIADTLISVNRL